MWNTDQSTEGGMRSKAEMFMDYGVFLQPAVAKGQHGDAIAINRLMFSFWEGWDRPDFMPKLQICENCRNTIDNWQLLVYDEWSDSIQHEKGKKETIKNRHVDSITSSPSPGRVWSRPAYRTA